MANHQTFPVDHGVVYRNEDSYCGPISMLLKLPDEELLLIFREARWRGRVTHMDPTTRTSLLRSRDGGRTWSETAETPLWCGGSSPPDLKLLGDGRVLMTRGYRREPFGVRAHISEDEGDTWAEEVVLRDDGLDRDVGYPSTVQFADGGLLTVYYWHGEDEIRHLQRTIWRLS